MKAMRGRQRQAGSNIFKMSTQKLKSKTINVRYHIKSKQNCSTLLKYDIFHTTILTVAISDTDYKRGARPLSACKPKWTRQRDLPKLKKC